MCEGLSKISSNFTSHLIKVGKLKRYKKVSSYLKTTLKTDLADLPFLGVILWVLRVLGQGLNQSARIFFTRVFSGCYAILTSPKEGETAVYGYNPALFWVLSVLCWCLAELIFTYLDQPCSILLAEFNMAAFTALFKNTRTLKFKGQLTFAYFAAVNHLSGPLRKQWSVIGGFRLACVQTPLPSGKVLEGTPSPIFPEGRGVCTQARFPSVFCVSVFHRSFFNFRVHVF